MANQYEVKITAQALAQMREINDYIAHELQAPDAARNLLDKMQFEIKKLSEFPKKHKLIEEEPWHSEGVRKIIVNNFLVYYWIDEDNMLVQGIAVIYEKRDQIKQLAKIDFKN